MRASHAPSSENMPSHTLALSPSARTMRTDSSFQSGTVKT